MLVKKNLTKNCFSGYTHYEFYGKLDGLDSTKNNRMEKTPCLYSKGVIVV